MKQRVFKYLNKIFEFYNEKPIIACSALALVLNFCIEILSRHSLLKAFKFVGLHPVMFLFNTAIIFMTLTIAFLFKRRNFVISLFSVLWLSLGVINCILLFFRTTPLSLIDFLIVKTAFSMFKVYLNVFEMILVLLWLIALIVGSVIAWIKMPHNDVKMKSSVLLVVCSVICVCVTSTASTSVAAKNGSFAILTKAYENLGFVYCFSRGLIDSGIDEPQGYNEETVQAALDKIPEGTASETVKPNIIAIQLESFFDPTYVKGITCSEDPIPNFTALKKTCPTGLLTVPSMGGGTANSEFEFLTGINLDLFGVGEYPYQTILKEPDTPCDSIPFVLKDKGYKATAIHNHTAAFYSRYKVYSNIGFDRFVPVEFMDIYERNTLGWAKDSILLSEIEDALNTTEERDFIFTVTMQGHGKYPKTEIEHESYVTASGFDETTEKGTEFKYGFEYYINQLRETDYLIGQILDMLKNYPEPTALLLYGDHLPAFDITGEDLKTGDIYRTEYVLWTNYKELPQKKENLYAYQLGTLLFDKLDLNGGRMINITKNLKNSSDYEPVMHTIAYDMIYGNRYSLKDTNVAPTDLHFGIKPIVIDEVNIGENNTDIRGNNFTAASRVLVDGKKIDTAFISSKLLIINTEDLNPEGCQVSVTQVNKEFIRLSETAPVTVAPFEVKTNAETDITPSEEQDPAA